jgi:hypothetical protein
MHAQTNAHADQMHEVGFELLVFSFQTATVEDLSAANIASVKKQVDYAKSKGIEVGGYDLIVLDRSTYANEFCAGVSSVCFDVWY